MNATEDETKQSHIQATGTTSAPISRFGRLAAQGTAGFAFSVSVEPPRAVLVSHAPTPQLELTCGEATAPREKLPG